MSASVILDPAAELERATSDYLAVSRNASMYATTQDYQVAEDRAWERVIAPARPSRRTGPYRSPNSRGSPRVRAAHQCPHGRRSTAPVPVRDPSPRRPPGPVKITPWITCIGCERKPRICGPRSWSPAFRGWNDRRRRRLDGARQRRRGPRRAPHRRHRPRQFYDFQTTRPMIDTTVLGPDHHVPEVEIYAARVPDGPHDVVLVAGSEPSMRWRQFTTAVLDAAQTLGVGRVVLLGSLLADVVHTHPVHLTGLSPDPALIDEFGLRAPSYHGPTGIVGVLQHSAAHHGLQALSLWAPVPHYARHHQHRPAFVARRSPRRTASASRCPLREARPRSESR